MNSIENRCYVCGNNDNFHTQNGFSLREACCLACGASRRTSDLARCIIHEFGEHDCLSLRQYIPSIPELKIYEAQADGALHKVLMDLPGYVCSEFLVGVAPGALSKDGVRCENLEALTFPDNSFDLVVTQDVFEHIAEPIVGFREIARVLRPGGKHIFTVPVHEGRKTVVRVDTQSGKPVFCLPKVYHGDPLRPSGCLVYTDFGDDIPQILGPLGYVTKSVSYERFYTPSEIPSVMDEASWKRYEELRNNGEQRKFFMYNSVVFVSKIEKNKLHFSDFRIEFTHHTDKYQILGTDEIQNIAKMQWDIQLLRGEGIRLHGKQTLAVDATLSCHGRTVGVIMMTEVQAGNEVVFRFPTLVAQAGDSFALALAGAMAEALGRSCTNSALPPRFLIDAAGVSLSSDGPAERVLPGQSPWGTLLAHIRRYQFAETMARGVERGLDLGCGVGYGLGLMSCLHGTGVDVSPEALAWARGVYQSDNRNFVHAPIEAAADADGLTGRYGVVTAFEILEHLQDHAPLMDLARERMTDDGVFIVSVPCPELHGKELNPYHKRNFTPDHFKLILRDAFQQVEFYHQGRDIHGDVVDRYHVHEGLPAEAEFWLAVCRRPRPRRRQPKVSIVIPLFNRFDYTLQALIAIAKNTPEEADYEVVLVDNASSDETPRALRKLSGDVVLHRNSENLGFAKASNQGALLARGEYVVFLNNDTEVRPGWLQALVEELDSNPAAGIVGGRLLYPDGTVQHAGVAIGRDMVPIHVHRGLPADHELVMERRTYPIVTAACAAVRRQEFYALGMFDEEFINGHEDIDLCLRYRAQGKEVVYRPDCMVIHHESVSEGRMASRPHNLARTMRKWRYSLLQDDFLFCCTAASRGNPAKALRFAIKIGPPDRSQTNWGDTYFAESLARAMIRRGHACRIDYLNEWGREDLDIDVVIHLKGLSEYHPKPYNMNILWMLNHPSRHTAEELSRYDAVLVASTTHADRLKDELPVPVYAFLQATDDEHFRPLPEKKCFDLVFVGNNRGVGRLKMRQIIADLLPTTYSLAVWGDGWAGLLPEGVWQGKFVPWEELPRVYAQGRVVLNDHQPEMRESGFINNRTYDAIASGALVLSDYVQGMEDVLPVRFYTNPADLRRALKELLKNRNKTEKAASALREKVLASFTFDHRVAELLDIVESNRTEPVVQRIKSSKRRALDPPSAEQPLVSVLMSTHNRREFLPAAIASVQAQTYQNWELVLVRDGGAPVSDIVHRANDARIRLIDMADRRGKGHAINRAFRESRGQFIAYLDDDDIFHPIHLEKLLFFLKNVPSVRMVVSNTEKVTLEENERGEFREVKRELIYHRQINLGDLLERNQITWLSVMHDRGLFAQAGGLDETLSALLDFDLWRRMVSLTYPYHVSSTTAEYYLRKCPAISGRGQITRMAESDPPRYLANRLRVLSKRLPIPHDSPIWPTWERLRNEARHEFLLARGRKFKAEGNLARCRSAYTLAARLKGNPPVAWRELGLAELEAGNHLKAATAFMHCLNAPTGRDVSDYLYAALACLELGRGGDALICLARLEGEYRINEKVGKIVAEYRKRAAGVLNPAMQLRRTA